MNRSENESCFSSGEFYSRAQHAERPLTYTHIFHVEIYYLFGYKKRVAAYGDIGMY